MVSPEEEQEQEAVMERPTQLLELRRQLQEHLQKVRQLHQHQDVLQRSWRELHRRHRLRLCQPSRPGHTDELLKQAVLRLQLEEAHRKWQRLLRDQLPPQALLTQKHQEELTWLQRLQWDALAEERERRPPPARERWEELSEEQQRHWDVLQGHQQCEWEQLVQLRHDVQMVVCLLRHSLSVLRLQDLLRRMRRQMQLHRERLARQLQLVRSLQKKQQLRPSPHKKHQRRLRQLLQQLHRDRREEARHQRRLPRYLHKYWQQLLQVQAWLLQQQKMIRLWWQRRGWDEDHPPPRRLGPVPAI